MGSLLVVRDGIEEVTKSDVVLPMIGRCLLRANTEAGPFSRSAWTAAAASFTSDDDESDFCSMISDMLRFFSIGFLCKNELLVDSWLTGSDWC